MLASQKGKIKIVMRLIEANADLNLSNKRGSTATFHAVADGQREILELLAQNGADLSVENRAGQTVLDAGVSWLERSKGKERERILETCRWLADEGCPCSETTLGALAAAGIELSGEVPKPDESKREEVIGAWRLHKVVYYSSRDDNPSWSGPETLPLTGEETGGIVLHPEGGLDYTRWRTKQRGTWMIHGRNIKAEINGTKHRLELAANGKTLKFHMYDEEHGAPYADVYVRS